MHCLAVIRFARTPARTFRSVELDKFARSKPMLQPGRVAWAWRACASRPDAGLRRCVACAQARPAAHVTDRRTRRAGRGHAAGPPGSSRPGPPARRTGPHAERHPGPRIGWARFQAASNASRLPDACIHRSARSHREEGGRPLAGPRRPPPPCPPPMDSPRPPAPVDGRSVRRLGTRAPGRAAADVTNTHRRRTRRNGAGIAGPARVAPRAATPSNLHDRYAAPELPLREPVSGVGCFARPWESIGAPLVDGEPSG